jgi:magnesium transporter
MKLTEELSSLNSVKDILFRRDKRVELFSAAPIHERLSILHALTPRIRREILLHIPDDDLVSLLEAAAPDYATDMLQLLTKHKRAKALELLSDELRNSLSVLLEFDPDTAAGLMTLDYIQADKSEDVGSVAKKFREHEQRTARPPVILVMDEGRLLGYLPGYELGLLARSESIAKKVKRIPKISHAATHGEVMQVFRAHPHGKVAVLNDSGDVLGIIYSDDMLKVVQDRESASLYDYAGVSAEEGVTDSVGRKIQFRYKWLIINLATAFLAAFTVGQFEDIISKYVLLAVYMPIVAGMGGNAATQTLAVLVRGIALRQITLGTAWHALKNEVGAGLANGLINGFLVAFVVLFKDHDWKIALVLALAMVVNLVVAATFGTLVPLIMSKLRKDPAASATIFITTATDVLGFLVFLGLATIILA